MTHYKFQVSFVKPEQVSHLPRDKNYVAIRAPYDVTAEQLGRMILDGYQKLNYFLREEDIVFVIRVEADE
jgi:hypothetical protein